MTEAKISAENFLWAAEEVYERSPIDRPHPIKLRALRLRRWAPEITPEILG